MKKVTTEDFIKIAKEIHRKKERKQERVTKK